MIHQLGNDLKKKKKKPNQLGLKVTGWSDIPNPSTLAPHNSFWGLSVAEEILPQAGVTVHLQKENWAHRYFNSKKEKKKKRRSFAHETFPLGLTDTRACSLPLSLRFPLGSYPVASSRMTCFVISVCFSFSLWEMDSHPVLRCQPLKLGQET